MKLLIVKVKLYAHTFWATLSRAREKAISPANQVFSHVVKRERRKGAESAREHLELVKDELKDVISEGIA